MSAYVLVQEPLSRRRTSSLSYPASSPAFTEHRRLLHFVAAGTSAAFASALYNPLDCLRVRWQVTPHSPNESIWEFATTILKNEGLMQGLWRPGVGANAIGMAVSAALRFGYYESVRDVLVATQPHGEKQYWHMVVAGLACGSVAYSITTPFHYLKTRIQAEQGLVDAASNRYVTGARVGKEPHVTELVSGAMRIVREDGGIRGLYKGALPLGLRGALFTAGQMIGYDGLKTVAKRNGFEDGTPMHVCCSVSASFGASFLSAPADLVMAKYMSSKCEQQSLADCILSIKRQHGMAGFWRGWPLFFARLTPVMLTFSTVYEQLRKELGLGYFD